MSTKIGDQNVQSVWEKVLLEMNDMTADYAADFEKVELRGADELVVTLKNSYNRDMCARPQSRARIESTLQQIAGQQLRVDFLVSKHPAESALACLLYTSPSPRDATLSRMPSSA